MRGRGAVADHLGGVRLCAYLILREPNGLVMVGPVGLEPTTYGLKIWPLARASAACHPLADLPTVEGKIEFQVALS
jgi:hypothetical protein